MTPDSKRKILAEFKRQLKQALPGYKSIRAGMPYRTTFRHEHSADLHLYVMVHWSSYGDEMTLEIGWTYKKTLDDISSYFDPKTVTKYDAVMISLSALKGEPEVYRQMRGLAAEPERLKPVIADAIEELVKIGVPMLERIVSLH